MADNDKLEPAVGTEKKPEKGKPKTEPLPVVKPLHPGYPGPGRTAPSAPVAALAKATGTFSVVLAALMAAYGWRNETQLTRAEFIEKRDAWLARPATEV